MHWDEKKGEETIGFKSSAPQWRNRTGRAGKLCDMLIFCAYVDSLDVDFIPLLLIVLLFYITSGLMFSVWFNPVNQMAIIDFTCKSFSCFKPTYKTNGCVFTFYNMLKIDLVIAFPLWENFIYNLYALIK